MQQSPYQELLPSPRLRAYVECYWSLEEQPRSRNICILPDGCVDILFSTLNHEPLALTAVGLMTKPLLTAVEAGQSFFGVCFRPGMASAFLRETPILNDKVEPLDDMWGAAGRSLFERLAESPKPERMAEVMNTFLRPKDPPDAVQRMLRALSATTFSLDRLASETGLSERHFRRASKERTGVSPKYLRRLLRFRSVVERIRELAASKAQPSWAQLAGSCGYFDQAHLIREFQEFAAVSPGRFLQSERLHPDLESNHHEPES